VIFATSRSFVLDNGAVGPGDQSCEVQLVYALASCSVFVHPH
jgi:hypothetical protein